MAMNRSYDLLVGHKCVTEHTCGGAGKWKRKRVEEGLKRKNNDKAEKIVRIGFKDRGGKRMFYVADNGQGFEARARKRAGKREHLLLYSLGIFE